MCVSHYIRCFSFSFSLTKHSVFNWIRFIHERLPEILPKRFPKGLPTSFPKGFPSHAAAARQSEGAARRHDTS